MDLSGKAKTPPHVLEPTNVLHCGFAQGAWHSVYREKHRGCCKIIQGVYSGRNPTVAIDKTQIPQAVLVDDADTTRWENDRNG